MNYDKGWVLNFVVRQLLREYTVIMALTNLKFVYTNGYPERSIMVGGSAGEPYESSGTTGSGGPSGTGSKEELDSLVHYSFQS